MQTRRLKMRVALFFFGRLMLFYLVPFVLAGVLIVIESMIWTDRPISHSLAHTLQVSAVVIAFAVLAGGVALVGWYAGRPITTAIRWVENLRDGVLSPPRTPAGQVVGQTADGRWRGSWRLLSEVFDSLDVLTEDLGRAEVERERVKTARDDWLAGVSHDLKTPLSSIRGYALLIESDPDESDETRRQAAAILQQTTNIESLISDLELTFRVQADALPVRIGPVDIAEVAEGAVMSVAGDPRVHGREVAFRPSVRPVVVMADGAHLKRAVVNLIMNAAIHNPEGTHVTVSVEARPEAAIITVDDDGIGMDEETVARLFERYYRGGPAGEDEGGTGLGMAVARELVMAQGGSISVDSTPGRGTSIAIRLPEVRT